MVCICMYVAFSKMDRWVIFSVFCAIIIFNTLFYFVQMNERNEGTNESGAFRIYYPFRPCLQAVFEYIMYEVL